MNKDEFLNINDADALDGLIQALNSEEAILFVGAGLSTRLNYPSWTQLLQGLAKIAEEDINETRLNNEVIKYAKELKNKILEKEHSHKSYHNYLTRTFATPQYGFNDAVLHKTELHELIVKLPVKSFVTTNYDKAIEYFLKKENPGIEGVDMTNPSMVGKFLFRHKDKNLRAEVLHIHGVYNSPSTIILSEDEYDTAYVDKISEIADEDGLYIKFKKPVTISKPMQKSVLWTLLSTRQVIFIGFGMQDEYFIKMLKSVCDDLWDFDQMKHFAIMPFYEDAKLETGDDFKKEDQKCWQEALKFKRDYGVQGIFYYCNDDETHSGLLELVKMLISENHAIKDTISFTAVAKSPGDTAEVPKSPAIDNAVNKAVEWAMKQAKSKQKGE